MPMIEIDPTSEPVRTLVLILDLSGTFVFALSGGMAGIQRRLDIYGVLVVAFVASSFGGIGRDLLIGAVPPAALMDWRYLAVSLAAGLVVFFWSSPIKKLRHPVRLLDAAGLAFFCVAGAQKALVFGLGPVAAALLGMVTAVGGGVVRDLLLAEVPTILRSELYAVAALAGAGVVVGGGLLHLSHVLTAIAAGLGCFALRVIAIRRGWHLPVAEGKGAPHSLDKG
jgi:uncharacterized membrane protein YeiH